MKEFAEHRSKKGNYGVEFFGYASYYANMWSKNLNLLIFLLLATDKENLIVLVEISVKRNPTGTVVLLITSMKSIDLKPIDFRCSINFSSDFTVFPGKSCIPCCQNLASRFFPALTLECTIPALLLRCLKCQGYLIVFSIKSQGSRAIRTHIAFFLDMLSSWIWKWQKV